MGTVIIVNALLQILFAMLISPATQRVSLHSFAFRTGWPIGALVLVVAITNALVERIVQKTRRVVLECYTQHREWSAIADHSDHKHHVHWKEEVIIWGKWYFRQASVG